MFLAILITVVYLFIVWLVFFKMKWIKFNIAWGLVSAFVGLHVLLIFLIGLRFVTPYSTDAKVIQHTIQLIPRLPQPTLGTGVLVEPNVPVKKGQPLFQFDRRPYEYKVNAVKAQLAAAQQHVLELKAQRDAASGAVAQAQAQRAALKAGLDAARNEVGHARAKQNLARSTMQIADELHKLDTGAISKLKLDEARMGFAEGEAAVKVAEPNETKAPVAYEEQAEAPIKIPLPNDEKTSPPYHPHL